MKTRKYNINKSRLFKRAWYLTKQGYNGTFSFCLKFVWKETKDYQDKQRAIEEETERLNKWWASDEYKELMKNQQPLDCSNYYHGEGARGRYFGD